MNTHIKLLLLTLLLGGEFLSANAHRFSSTLFFILDTYQTNEKADAVKCSLEQSSSGLYLHLRYDVLNDDIVLESEHLHESLDTYLSWVKQVFENDPRRIIPLFFSYNGPSKLLLEKLKQYGLYSYVYSHPRGETWPDVQTILSSKRRLILFSFDRNSADNSIFHYAWDYIADLPYSGSDKPSFAGFYSHGTIDNELLLVRDFISPFYQSSEQNKIGPNLATNPYYLQYLLSAWHVTGKCPNFVFTHVAAKKLETLYAAFRTYIPIYGSVVSYQVPLKQVRWKNKPNSITYGNFCFPFSEGEDSILEPYCSGYVFSNKKIELNNKSIERSDAYVIEVESSLLVDGLTSYFNFEREIKNLMLPDKAISVNNCTIVVDQQRGSVLKAGASSSITIGDGDHFGIRNNSFTVGTWLKLNDEVSSRDYSIIGTKAYRFREELHLVIRDNCLYFDLYGNDFMVNYQFKKKQWYHLVFRYDLSNGEQAIFINGRKMGSSLYHQSFIGLDDLTLCSSLGNTNPSIGYLDDFCIWRRALGEDEISRLYTIGIPKDFKPEDKFLHYCIGMLFSLVLLILVLRRYFQMRKADQEPPHLYSESDLKQLNMSENQIQIRTFGQFEIFNVEMNEIGQELSNQLSKIFILLLLQLKQKNQAVKIDLLNHCFWPDSDTRKTTNSRNVAITKLRKYLDQYSIGTIIYRNNSLFLELHRNVKVDFILLEEYNYTSRAKKGEVMQDFLKIVEGGQFLSDYRDGWLEEYRYHYSNIIISTCEDYLQTKRKSNYFDLIVAERLLKEDEFNEIGFTTKLQTLYQQGHVEKVRLDYKNFSLLYQTIYGETYPHTLEQCLHKRKIKEMV